MTTLEQVEKLRERANVGYDEAKAALDATNGDLLEALIYLEKQGRVKAPQGNGYYSSEASADPHDAAGQDRGAYRRTDRGSSFSDLLGRFGRFCLRLLRKGNTNTLEVMKGDESKASIPVTALVLLLIFTFWVTLPLMIIGLFFGLSYRFQGPDLGRESVNRAMDGVAQAADDLKRSVANDKK